MNDRPRLTCRLAAALLLLAAAGAAQAQLIWLHDAASESQKLMAVDPDGQQTIAEFPDCCASVYGAIAADFESDRFFYLRLHDQGTDLVAVDLTDGSETASPLAAGWRFASLDFDPDSDLLYALGRDPAGEFRLAAIDAAGSLTALAAIDDCCGIVPGATAIRALTGQLHAVGFPAGADRGRLLTFSLETGELLGSHSLASRLAGLDHDPYDGYLYGLNRPSPGAPIRLARVVAGSGAVIAKSGSTGPAECCTIPGPGLASHVAEGHAGALLDIDGIGLVASFLDPADGEVLIEHPIPAGRITGITSLRPPATPDFVFADSYERVSTP